jgi:hypothetical protein
MSEQLTIKTVKIGLIKTNPKNPRIIKDDKFKKLVKSIQEFPEMLAKRPLICFTDTDGKFIVLGGNMRLKASQECGLKELPIMLADEWSEEQKNEFLIRDNISAGDWDWDDLANNYDADQLTEWGLKIPYFEDANYDEPKEENKDLIIEPNLKIIFKTPDELQKAHNEIQELLDRNYPNALLSINIGDY